MIHSENKHQQCNALMILNEVRHCAMISKHGFCKKTKSKIPSSKEFAREIKKYHNITILTNDGTDGTDGRLTTGIENLVIIDDL